MIYIKQVKIKDFKNFTDEKIFIFSKGTNIITGINGSGKTSILSAICWCLINKLYDNSQEGWKPKEMFVDESGNMTSKVKQLFNTLVEVTIGFDDGQKDIIVKRTSCCGKSTTLYYNGITDTQKQINKYLEQALGFDISRLLILVNPEILFNTKIVEQQECAKLIFDSVRNSVKDDLKNLYDHLFDSYNENISSLEDNTLEKSLAKRLVTDISKKLEKNISENEIIEDLEAKITNNTSTLDSKNEAIKSQELILQEYYQHLQQQEAFKQLEQNLDRVEQIFRDKDFQKSRLQKELSELETENNKLKIWLHDFNILMDSHPSVNQIKKAFGYKVDEIFPEQTAKINVLNISNQRTRCPVCGNWYIPKQDPKQMEIIKKIAEINKEITASNNVQPKQKPTSGETFNYLPDLMKIKERMSEYSQQIDTLKDQIDVIDKNINSLEFKSKDEIQIERNRISKFLASLETGKSIAKIVNAMKDACEECNIINKYLNILYSTIQEYQKAKLRIITKKLNTNLHSGFISLFKIQQNGVIKESVTIIDKHSYAEYKETNQSKKIKLGIEVCKILQDFNGINFPIFIDEIGRFSDYSFIKDLDHQIIATLPTKTEILEVQDK